MIALIVTMTIVMGATINSLINDIAITPRATNTIVIASNANDKLSATRPSVT